MKRKWLNFFLIVCCCYQGMAQNPFITSWSVTAGDEITIPVNTDLAYDFSYVWKDDSGAEIAPVTQATGDIVQQFSLTGTVTLEITGAFPHFRNYPKDQLLDVQQWGDIVWRSFEESFQSWGGERFTATDVPNLSQVTNFFGIFQSASSFNGDLSNWDVSNITNMERAFRQALAFNGDISGWQTSNVQNMNRTFGTASSFNQDISGWDISSVTNMTNLLNGTAITPNTYDKILIGWSQQEVRFGVTFGASGRSYCAADAERSVLRDNFGWTIRDAGQSCEGLTDIQSFSFEELVGEAIIDAENFTIAATALFGTDLTALTPSIELAEGVTSTPGDDETVDFTNPVTYTVTYTVAGASNTLTQDWVVTVSAQSQANDETDILSFTLDEQLSVPEIDEENHTIRAEVAFDAPIGSLMPTIAMSAGATISPTSDEAVDFSESETSPVIYTVTAQDGTTVQVWEVTVIVEAIETDILSFSIPEQLSEAVIDTDNHTVFVEVAFDAPIGSLVPTISVSNGATISPASDASQDFNDPVTYTVTGKDETTMQGWEVTVVFETIKTDILNFTIPEQVGEAIIDTDNYRVDLFVPSGTGLTLLVPDFTLSEGATSSPESGVAQDFTNPVLYTITGKDGITEQDWVISVSEQRPFITSWFVTDGDEITIPVNNSFTYDFSYVWKDDTGTDIAPASQATGDIVQRFTTTGTVTLEIIGTFPHFQGYPKDQLLDVQQWGDIAWQSFAASFQSWTGTDFSAVDEPELGLVTNMSSMFREAGLFNGNIGSWQVGSVDNMNRMFNDADAFNQDLNEWDVSNVTNMGDMFLNADIFNGDLSKWDVANVTNMAGMFASARAFNGDLSAWDVGKVTSMRAMFISARNFQGDLSAWDVSSVTQMNNLFQDAVLFNSDLSDWEVSNVKNMVNMFASARAFNADISQWDVGNATNMQRMFSQAGDFNADLSAWDVSKVTNMGDMFNLSGLSPQNYDKALIAWAILPDLQSDVSLGAEGITFCKAINAKATLEGLGWIIEDEGLFCLDETDILSVAFATQTGEALIDVDNQTVTVEVLFTNVLDTLAPSITLSPGATINPASGEPVDFTNPASFTVTAEDGVTTQGWIISVTVAPPSQETDILSFEFAEQTGAAVINTADNNIAIEVGFGTEVSSLIPTFTLSEGATSNPVSGEEADFSDPVVYTITAQDGTTTQDWTVSVTVAPNTETDILTFILSEQTGDAVINRTGHTVEVEVEFGTELSALVPTFALSEGATSNPASSVSQDFTSPVTYAVRAQDGTTSQDWTVSVTVAPNTETDILTFILSEQTGAALINIANHTVAIEVAADTDASVLIPTFTLSQDATSNPASGVAQDFTNPVTYVVTAEDGTATQDWTVVVTVADSPLGLDDEIDLRIYPNPVSHVLQVKTKEELSISLTDLNGRVIIGEKQGSLFQMDLNNLKSGTYVLMIRSGNEITSRRIIKNN